MKMRIYHYIQVLALLGAVSCGSSEPTVDPGAKADSTTDATSNTEVADVQGEQAIGDTLPEVRYYLLSEQ